MSNAAPARATHQANEHDNYIIQRNRVTLCSGYGKWHSTKNKSNPQPYVGITMDEIQARLPNPQTTNKNEAQWVIFSSLLTREHKTQQQQGTFYALWADVDDTGGLSFDGIFSRVMFGAVQCAVLAYTSRSATKEIQKCRLIIPLSEPIPGEQFVAMQKILNARLRDAGLIPDIATERAGQVCYLPNAGEFYASDVENTNEPLVPADWAEEIAKQDAADEAKQNELHAAREVARVKSQQRMASGCKSPIAAFNAEYALPLMLDTYGYIKKGDRWVSPNSESGHAGVSLTDDGCKWLSAHSKDSEIGMPTNNGTMGDAFDLFVYYEHGGDRNAALKCAGEMFTTPEGLTLTKSNQREYMASKELQDATTDFDDLSSCALAQFALNGQSELMEKAMLADAFILGRIAILGQSTVIYAKPNAGKTLLTIWLIIAAIESGAMKGEDIYYVNADDNHKGLTYKLKLAEEHGFSMLAPGYNDFKAEKLAKVLQAMIQSDSARGKVLILDTVKKFTDIMRKDKASVFGEAVRQFVSHGGSVIMLAHTNKHRGDDGKVIYSGTSDLVDDVDCAYTLDVMTEDKFTGTRTVKFENFKSRGDVEAEAVYEYDFSNGANYQKRLDSIKAVNDEGRQAVERQKQLDSKYEQNREAIDAIREALHEGVTHKTELVTKAMELSGVSRNRVIKALNDHTGTSIPDYQYWSVSKEDKNAHVYKLN